MMNRQYTTTTNYTMSDILSWQREGSLTLSPWFQRRPNWKPSAKSYFLDSIMKGYPVPLIIFREVLPDVSTKNSRREVVDGQQRLRTLLAYVDPNSLPDYDEGKDAFQLQKAHNSELAGCRFDELPDDAKRAILRYTFSVQVLPPETSDGDLIQLFSRINSTGTRLNGQELRNAEFHGFFKISAYELAAAHVDFWINSRLFDYEDISRMKEVELVSDCMHGLIEGVSGISQPRLNALYERFETEFPEKRFIESAFKVALSSIEGRADSGVIGGWEKSKALFYPLFMCVAIRHGLIAAAARQKTTKAFPRQFEMGLSKSDWKSLIAAIREIKAGTAPKNVLESASRRTTNPQERATLTRYLLDALD